MIYCQTSYIFKNIYYYLLPDLPKIQDMEEASSLIGSGDRADHGITVDMMDYKYINDCNDVKVLEKILRALRSGQNGYYPHLVKHCEEKVAKLNPKSRALRTENPILKSRDLPSEEQTNLSNNMNDWIKHMNESEKITNGFTEKELPPVRNAAVKKEKKNVTSTTKPERIRGNDFRAWDKYNADEECEKLDNPDYVAPQKPKNNKISFDIDTSGMSEMEKEISAGKEKDKGNEAFKAGDYEEALAYYSRSIALKRSAASINNRALTYIRLKQWSDAESDCNEVLDIEPDNLKAKLRRATALKELTRYQEARNDLEFVLEKEPNNARAKKIMEEVKNKLATKGRKMKIMEVDEDEEQEDLQPISQPSENHVVNRITDEENSSSKPSSTVSEKIASNEQQSVSLEDKSPSSVAEESNQETNVVKSASTSVSNAQPSNTETKEVPSEPKTSQLQDSESKSSLPVESEPVQPEVNQAPLPSSLEPLKTDAGNLFRSGQYGLASDKYSLAIKKLNAKIDATTTELSYSHALATLYNNRAACKLKSGDDKACIADCAKVLELKPGDVKALIRRASAYEHMEKYKLAYEDFRAAQTIDWTASQAQVGANRVAKHLRDMYGPNWRDIKSDARPNELSIGATGQTKAADAKSSKKSSSAPKSSVPSNSKQTPTHPVSASKSEPKKTTAASAKKTTNKSESQSQEEKREKIRRDLFTQLKNDGNALVKKGDYKAAIDNYTRCMQILPNEVASYTNRALCFLKLNKSLSAVQDCTEAMKIDPTNVKAYFRRGQANKNLGQFHEAEKDLRKVLEIDAGNKLAANELNEVRKSLKSSTKRKIPIVEVNEDEEESTDDSEKLKQTTNATKKVPSEVKSKPVQPPASTETIKGKVSSAEERAEPATNESPVTKKSDKKHEPSEYATSSSKNTSSSDALKQSNIHSNPEFFLPQVPAKLSPYEFGNLWNSIPSKTNVAAYKCILDNVPVERIPPMVSNKTTDHMITMFARIARLHLKVNSVEEANRAYGILANLVKAQRFEMAAMFLSKPDKHDLGETFAQLANCIKSLQVSYTFDDVNKLRAAYML